MALAHVFFLGSLGIGPQHEALGLDLTGESIERGRQSADVVAIGLQPAQEVVHRRDDLHAAGQQRILARPFEVCDGYSLLAVGLRAQTQVAVDVFDKRLATLHLGRPHVIAAPVRVLRADAEGCHAPVYFRNDDARVLRSGRHRRVRVHPFVVRGRNGEGREERNVLFVEPGDERVVAQTAHGHVDNGVGLQLAEHADTLLARTCHGIDIVAAVGEHRDEGVHMLAIALHGELQSGDERQPWCPVVIELGGFQVGSELLGGLEVVAVSAVIEHVLQDFHRSTVVLVAPTVRCGDVAQVSQPVAEVLSALVLEVLLQLGCLLVGEMAVETEAGALQRLCEDNGATLGGALHRGQLFVAEEETSAIEHDGIVVVELWKLVGIGEIDLNVPAVVVQREVGLLCFQRVHDEDARGCQPAMVAQTGQRDDGNQRHDGDDGSFLRHSFFPFRPFSSSSHLSVCLL